MSTEVESSVVLPVLAAAAEPGVPSPAAAATTPAASSGSPPTSPATGTSSRTPFKKEKKKVSEKTDEYLLARFQGDGVRYKAKLIGVDDVGEARGDKMSQDSMMKLKGMAVAGRTQGKHKQKIWVNITMSGIKIIDEKSGVIEHEHIVNKISFIARDVTDNRAFGYVCGAEGQHQFYAIKTSQQAEPLVIDLKDLFTVIFNVRKKEAEASQKGGSGTVVENGSDALPSADGQTAKPAEQLDLFGDMSTPPDIHSPSSAANDLFGGADLFAAPSQPEGLSDPAVVDLFASTTASIAALGNLQMGPPVTCMPGATWGAATTMPSMYSMPGAQHAAYPQPSAFGGLPIPPSVWGQQMPSQYGAPPVPLGAHAWGHPPLQAGPIMGGAAPPGWGAQPSAVNPFQAGPYAMMGVQQVVPPRPPPRPPVKEVPAPPKVENSAFTALDPLGEKEKKHGKDMFKDFQMAKPPAIPARKGEQQVASTNGGGGGGAFDQYFSSKVGVLQDEADYDDFDLHEIASFSNAPLELSPAAALAPSPSRGLLDAAFSTTPAPGPAQGLNQNMFDQAFGAPDASPFGVPLLATSPPVAQTSGSSDPFGDPFGNPFA